jgi:2-oxoglutarate ferredoxin oxidoreductase subunit alpha
VAECYSLTRRAFDLAERFRVPVFLMTDKEMFLSMSTAAVDGYEAPPVRARTRAVAVQAGTSGLRAEESHLPYRFEPIDRTPPFAPIGGEFITRFTGSSHDEHAMLTKDPAKVGRLNEHLVRKIEDHADEIALVTADPQQGARTLLIAYGITARGMQEAVQRARAAGRPVSALTLQTLWPMPERAILGALEGIERIVVAELNHGDVRREVERIVYRAAALGRRVAPEIVGLHRVDGELLEPQQFLALVTP